MHQPFAELRDDEAPPLSATVWRRQLLGSLVLLVFTSVCSALGIWLAVVHSDGLIDSGWGRLLGFPLLLAVVVPITAATDLATSMSQITMLRQQRPGRWMAVERWRVTERERTINLVFRRWQDVERDWLRLIPLGPNDPYEAVVEVDVSHAAAAAAVTQEAIVVHGTPKPGRRLVLEIAGNVVWTERAQAPRSEHSVRDRRLS